MHACASASGVYGIAMSRMWAEPARQAEHRDRIGVDRLDRLVALDAEPALEIAEERVAVAEARAVGGRERADRDQRVERRARRLLADARIVVPVPELEHLHGE